MVVGNSLKYLAVFLVSNCLLNIRPTDGFECYKCNTGDTPASSCGDKLISYCGSGKYCLKMKYDEGETIHGCDYDSLFNKVYCPDKDGQTVTRAVRFENTGKVKNITGTVYCCGGNLCNNPHDERPKNNLECITCNHGGHCVYTETVYCDEDKEYCLTEITEKDGKVYDITKRCSRPDPDDNSVKPRDECILKDGKPVTTEGNFGSRTETIYCCQGDSCNAAQDTPHHLQCFTCNEYGGISCDFPATTYCASTVKYCSKVVYEIHGYEYFAKGCGYPDHCPGKDGDVIEYSYGAERTEYCCEGDMCNAATETRNTITWTIGPALFLLSKVVQLF